MSAVITPLFHANIARSIYEEVQNRSSIYHYFIGKTLVWEDELTPPIPSQYQLYENDVRNNIIQTKQIAINDVALVVPRINWEGGTVYDMFDDNISATNPAASGATSLKEARFYVITEDFNIYKCIFNNNGGASTVEPTGTGSTNFETSDGYIWKFISFIPLGLRNKFMTPDFVPITKSIKNQYYSSGIITAYNILDGGQDYNPDETYLVIQGDGSGPSRKNVAETITFNVEVASGTNDYGSGNKFYIDNSVSPDIKLLEGNTYRFDQSDASNTGHPLRFSITPDGTHNSGVEYTTGVTYVGTPGSPGAYTEIVVQDGVSNLSYYCMMHSGMGALAYTIASVGEDGQADIDLVIENGTITGLIINDGGYGYTDANAQVVTGPLDPGTGANITLNLSTGDLNTQQSNVELLAVDGSLSHIVIENSGIGYTNVSVNITGDGEGAEATATFNANGEIDKINITNYGSGYSYANASIIGDGTGAVVRAIIAPKGGHGSNAPDELLADTVCFYSSFENDKIAGYNFNNDYRQIGIIKNLASAGSLFNKFNGVLGSACYGIEVGSSFDPADFPLDSIVVTSGGTKEFRVVSNLDGTFVLQSLNGSVVLPGDVLYNEDLSDSFSVTGVTNPNVNKFSGEMLYIDNKLAFTPSDQQFVVFRTFIKF
jgi:hypothetical protein